MTSCRNSSDNQRSGCAVTRADSLPRRTWAIFRRSLFFCASLVLSFTLQAQTGGTGTINGTVRNEGTGDFLEGAEVRIVGTERVTTTQRDGSFAFAGVPAGRQQLRAFYTGLDVQVTTVAVTAGQTAVVPLALNAAIYKLEAFSVAGQREGNAVALTKQRNAENIVNVIATDAHGNIADGNIGSFMQRLPGVAAIYAEGDIIGVGLRGSPPDQSSLSIDGTLMTAAVAGSAAGVIGDRAPQLDRVPAELIKEIEVFKALMPDRDADGLGGAANLVTKSGFDFKNRVVTYKFGWNQNQYRSGQPLTPTGSFSLMDTLGKDRKIAIALSASYTQTVNTRDRVQGQRQEADGRNTQARLLDDTYDRVRWGYSAKLEYKLGEDTLLHASALYSNYSSDTRRYQFQVNDTGTRRVADYNVVSRAAIEAGAVPRTTAGSQAGVAPGFTDTVTEMINATSTRLSAFEVRRGSQYKFGLGGESRLGELKLKASANYSPADYDNRFSTFGIGIPGIGMLIDGSRDLERPVFRQTYGPDVINNPDFKLANTATLTDEPARTEEDISTAQLDGERAFATRWPLSFKTGVKWREQHRFTASSSPSYQYRGADRVSGLNPATGINDDNLAQFMEPTRGYGLFNGRYFPFQRIDFGRIQTAFRDNPAHFVANAFTVPPPTEITESVTAAYGMGRVKVGRAQFVGGVRVEQTEVEATGSLRDPGAPAQPTIRVARDYRKYFPSVHARYEPIRGLLLRASYSTSMARPGIGQITPNTNVTLSPVEGGLGSVSQNNPGLKPQFSKNYDLSAEYYFEPVGVLSAGVFRKRIKDYIFASTGFVSAGRDNGFDGRYEGFNLLTNGNAGSAEVEGVEFNYSQQLRFLPGALKGLSVFANYTEIEAIGTFEAGASELRNFIPRTVNVGLSFRQRGWEARASWNYTDSFLFAFNANPLLRQYKEAGRTLDLNLQYRWRPWLAVFVDAVNVFNETPSVYMAKNPRRMFFSEVYGARLTVGISGRF